jgi:drug/metabolite transporter (DMT)-like permease
MVTWGMTTVDSYIAALLVASMPLVVSIFDRIFYRKPIAWTGIAGIVCGIAGVALLLYDGRGVALKMDWDVLKVLAGVCSWGFATSISRRMKPSQDVLVNSTAQMFAASIPLLLVIGLTKGIPPLASFISDPAILVSMLFLIVGGTIALFAFNYLLKVEPAIRVVSYVFVNPLIAILLGIVLGGEKPARYLLPGAVLIFAGLVLLLYVSNRAKMRMQI